MRRVLPLILLLLAMPALVWAEPLLKLPVEVKGDPDDFIRVPAETTGKTVRWVPLDKGLKLLPPELLKSSLTGIVYARLPGRYRLLAYTASSDGEPSEPAITTVVVGEPGPVPPGPIPPGPIPPVPPPDPTTGQLVLIVYETSNLSKMPEKQQQILYGQTTRSYFDAKLPLEQAGKVHAWRIWDADVDTKAEAKAWQDAMKRPRASLPWVLIENKGQRFEGPLPASVDEAMTLFKKYLD